MRFWMILMIAACSSDPPACNIEPGTWRLDFTYAGGDVPSCADIDWDTTMHVESVASGAPWPCSGDATCSCAPTVADECSGGVVEICGDVTFQCETTYAGGGFGTSTCSLTGPEGVCRWDVTLVWIEE